ncbi:MAG: acetate kinase [Planctomycetes bacterium]|nr:acetate kinase [Planctomycetota bacterium]
MKILVINAGSSSIKYQLFLMPEDEVICKGVVEKIGEDGSRLSHQAGSDKHGAETLVKDHNQAMELILDTLVCKEEGVIEDITEITSVGHRVVHGGEEFSGSVIIDEEVIASIEKFSDLAPLHNPANLTGICAAREKLPQTQQVVCFDTAFHSTIPAQAYMYALPYALYEKYHIRRYGFHGTSHRYVARRAADLLGKDKYEVNLITCHLGNGCSITAIKQGESIDTSMGLTPLEGLMMGTRSGDIDPAILFYLADKGYDFESLNRLCNKESGLLGVSGESNDMRNLTELAAAGDKRAQLAIDIFCYRVKKYIGAYTAALGRVDAVVFTGGIGENVIEVRRNICSDLEALSVKLDPEKNNLRGQEAEISHDDSKIKVYLIPTNEEAAIARDTYELTREEI